MNELIEDIKHEPFNTLEPELLTKILAWCRGHDWGRKAHLFEFRLFTCIAFEDAGEILEFDCLDDLMGYAGY